MSKKDVGSIVPGIMAFGESSGSDIIDGLFFSKENYDLIRMKQLTELEPEQIPGFTILSVFQRRFKSKVLKEFQEENYLHQKSKDRQGSDEYLEVSAAIRRSSAMEERE